MGRFFHTAATIAAAAVSRSNRKKALRNIQKANEANRNLICLGNVTVDQVIPCGSQIGNVCISGGEQEMLSLLLVQSVLQSASLGLPVIVLHEGNHQLERELSLACSTQPYFRVINPLNPYYDPILRLSYDEAAMLIVESSQPVSRIDASGALYLRAIAKLLDRRGVKPYLRMLASCPHHSLQSVILKEEQSGCLSGNEADAIRNDLAAGTAARANIEYFFSQLQAEMDIAPWKSHLCRSTSILECVKSGGTIVIDIDSTNKKTQLAVITAEIEHCLSKGHSCRIVLDIGSIAGNEKLLALLKNSSGDLYWTISTPDIGNTAETSGSGVSTWLALSHKAVIFAHAIHSAEQLSREFGEYEYIEVTQAHSGNNSIGQFGLHFGANNNVSTTNKRERIVKPEEISGLSGHEFFLLDNNTASLSKGVFV